MKNNLCESVKKVCCMLLLKKKITPCKNIIKCKIWNENICIKHIFP